MPQQERGVREAGAQQSHFPVDAAYLIGFNGCRNWPALPMPCPMPEFHFITPLTEPDVRQLSVS